MRQMKQFVILLSVVLAFSSCVHKVQKEQQVKSIVHTNPLPVKFGDPYVLLASDGIYYMYGTGGGAVDGFSVYSSPDLVNWKAEGQVFRGNIPGSWGVANFWAPEVYERGGKFYMLYSADWKENPTNELEISVSEWPLQINRQDLSRNYPTNLCLIRAIRLSTGT